MMLGPVSRWRSAITPIARDRAVPRLFLLSLIALLSLAVGLALGGPVGTFIQLSHPLGSETLAAAMTNPTMRPLIAAAAALAVFLMAGYFIPAILDSVSLAGSASALRLLSQKQASGFPTPPAGFVAAFRDGPLRCEAQAFAATLWKNTGHTVLGEGAWQSLVDFDSSLPPPRPLREPSATLF